MLYVISNPTEVTFVHWVCIPNLIIVLRVISTGASPHSALGFLLGHQIGFVEVLNIDNIHGMFSILAKLSSRKVAMK